MSAAGQFLDGSVVVVLPGVQIFTPPTSRFLLVRVWNKDTQAYKGSVCLGIPFLLVVLLVISLLVILASSGRIYSSSSSSSTSTHPSSKP